MQRKTAASLLVALACLLRGGVVPAADVPEWLTSAAKAEARQLEPKVPAEVLVHEGRWAVSEKGSVEIRVQRAVRILTRAGRPHAVARAYYVTDTDKLRELRAWVIGPRGEARRLGKDETLDAAVGRDDVYNEQRVRVIDASDEVEVGEVFGYESVIERRSFFNQMQWSFQSALPTRRSRLEIALPPGWTSDASLFNHPPVEPVRAGSSLVWELGDLPFLDDEPGAPELASLVPRLAVSYAPPADKPTEARSFAAWADVARWAAEISDPRGEPDATVTAKARELTREAADQRQRLAAIARFVQGVPYISIQVGFGRFQPHAAPDVLARLYGDCKDKVSLMRALLKVVGISSYPFLVSAGDRSYVRREWPSPVQFDHVIVAIAVEGAAAQPAAIAHPALGTLLLFDPTDEHTQLGDLPEHEQGGLGLLAAGVAGGLASVPVIPSDAGQLVRETRAGLSERGALTAQIVERSVGQAAVRERRLWREQARQDYVATIERWLAEGIAGVRADRVEASEDADGGFRLEVDLAAERYAQLMQGRLLVFKPALVSRHDALSLTASKRQHPVVLHARAFTSTARIRLPAGFVVDERPTPALLETAFGSYTMTVDVEGSELVVLRRLKTKAVTLSVEEYDVARGFFRRIMDAEQAPVVLLKK